MSSDHRAHLMNDLFDGYNDDIINKRYCNRSFFHFLCDFGDCNVILTSLIATGQKDIVSVLFPDYLTQTRNRYTSNITQFAHHIDIDAMMRYIHENKLYVPGYVYGKDINDVRQDRKGLKTHAMKTRNDVKIPIYDMKSVLTSRVLKDDFDFHTDPFFKALNATGQRNIIVKLCPEYDQRLLFKD